MRNPTDMAGGTAGQLRTESDIPEGIAPKNHYSDPSSSVSQNTNLQACCEQA
jgi:hypothetical protein